MVRTLPVAAFVYTTQDSSSPYKSDYDAVAKATQKVFQQMYQYAFGNVAQVQYLGTEIVTYTVLSSRLVSYDINVYFHNQKQIPSLFQVVGISQSGLNQQGAFYDILLSAIKSVNSPVFSTTTAIEYISNSADLSAAEQQAKAQIKPQSDGGPNILVATLAPAVVGMGAMIVVAALLVYRKKKKGEEDAEATAEGKVVKHGDDFSTSSTYISDYRTIQTSHTGDLTKSPRAASPPNSPTLERWQETDDEESKSGEDRSIHPSPHQQADSFGSQLEDVPLVEEKIDVKQRVGEVQRSVVGLGVNSARAAQLAQYARDQRVPQEDSASSPAYPQMSVRQSELEAAMTSLLQQLTEGSPTKLNPPNPTKILTSRNTEQTQRGWIAPTPTPAPSIPAAKYHWSGETKPGWMQASLAAPSSMTQAVSGWISPPQHQQKQGPPLMNLPATSLKPAPKRPNDFPDITSELKAKPPVLRPVRGPSDFPVAARQSSAVPDTSHLETEDGENVHEAAEDEKSTWTIDSQSSKTPEWLKHFKTMGLKRYKE